MIIKNSDYNLSHISQAYNGTGKKAEKAAAAQGAANPNTFSAEVSKITNSAKVDRIEISKHPVSSQPALPAVRDKISSELRADKDPAFLADLKQKINSDLYFVNANELSKILLL